MVPLRARLFRFTDEADIDTKDFAEKTGMNLQSVISMLKQARFNAKLYEDMLKAGYTDGEFPAWWFSPGRASGEGAKAGETVDVPAEGGEPSIDVDKVDGVEGYEVVPPKTPAPREGRPALQAQRSDPILSDAIQAQQGSADFTDAELSYLHERALRRLHPENGCILRSKQMAGSC